MIPLGILAASGATGAMELIATVVSTGTGGQVSFASIPQTYRHLQLRVVARTGNSVLQTQTNGLAINNDTTNGKYDGHALTAAGSSVASGRSGFYNLAFQIPFIPGGNETSGAFGAQVIDFLDYSSASKNKTIRALGGHASGSSRHIGLFSNLYIDTAAITSIQYNFGGPDLAAGTRVSLYGIRG